MASLYTVMCIILVLVLLTLSSVRAAPIPPLDYMAYLEKYGYLDDATAYQQPVTRLMGEEDHTVRDAIMAFQRMAHIPQTGVIDDDTKAMMEAKRCGNPDGSTSQLTRKRRRRKRYVLQGSRWSSNVLTYKILNFSPDLSQSVQISEMKRAFDTWSKYTPLRFIRKTSGSVDIEIKFAVRDHGDGAPFDGPGKVLAHAFYPQYGGGTHMDDDETYSAFDPNRGVNLFQVFAHEIGHALGLAHSQERDALMAPYYRGYIANFQLHIDDITGIRAIYGANTPTTTTSTTTSTTTTTTTTRPPRATTTTTTPPPRGSFCTDGDLDAITVVEGQTIAFRGDEYAVINNIGIEAGYPKKNQRRISWHS